MKIPLHAAPAARGMVALAALTATLSMLLPESAWAVPSYSRRYGMECSGCHTMWGSLNAAGTTFRLSGYRAIFGKDLTPISEDVEIAKGVAIPSTLPLSIITGVGVDSRNEKREVIGAGGTSTTSKGSSLALEDASIFLTSPIGRYFSAFAEFPMYETRAWEFTPTGNFEARYNTPGRSIQFATERPTFEVAKFWWNNLLGESLPRDSVNLLAGITHLPTAYAAGKVRLSVNQYLIYERTALELISPRRVNDVVGGDPNDFLFRLSEPQVMAELNGMLTFGKPVTDTSKRETPWAEYHAGITNGSNASAANRSGKDYYGRLVMRYFNQSFGLFGFRSSDNYSDTVRTAGAIGTNVNGIMSGAQNDNKSTRWGPDFTLSLAPAGIPVWLENQFMYNRESDPTGFGREFKWRGGFHQLNWQLSKNTILYGRYDWLRGDAFDDTALTANGVTGTTRSTPKERDWVIGWQHLYSQNIKLMAEFRHHVFDDTATGGAIGIPVGAAAGTAALGAASANAAKLTDNGFTLRLMFGF